LSISIQLLPLICLTLTDVDCSIRTNFARQYVYLLTSIKSYELYSEHLNHVLVRYADLIETTSSNNNDSSLDFKSIFEQSISLFVTIVFPSKLKTLRFATTTTTTTTTTAVDASAIDHASTNPTTFDTLDDDEIDSRKEQYLISFASDLCRVCYRFAIDLKHRSTFEYSSHLFIHLLNASTTNHIGIIERLTHTDDSSMKTPEKFYFDYGRTLIQISIEQNCSLDQIVELTIRILDIFQSSDTIVERILADLIQVNIEYTCR
jgi:hypothetical protein